VSQHHGRQKRLAEQKKKRVAKSKNKANRPSLDEAAMLRRLVSEASAAPFGPTWISAGWERIEDEPELVSIVITRKLTGPYALPMLLLVDRTCLGVKSAMVARPMIGPELERFLQALAEAHGGLVPVDLLVAQSVVWHALDFAARLGFSPDPDFQPDLLGPRPALLLDTAWAKPERPLYLPGPDDDVEAIAAKLREAGFAGD
jgi:hypothetical protein